MVDQMDSLSPIMSFDWDGKKLNNCYWTSFSGTVKFCEKHVHTANRKIFPRFVYTNYDILQHWTNGCNNLRVIDFSTPVCVCQISDLAREDTPQLYVACGRGPQSTIRVLRHGLEVSEMAVSDLPGTPKAVWTVKLRKSGKFYFTSWENTVEAQ